LIRNISYLPCFLPDPFSGLDLCKFIADFPEFPRTILV
jgi:hypothetical protein